MYSWIGHPLGLILDYFVVKDFSRKFYYCLNTTLAINDSHYQYDNNSNDNDFMM